MIIKSKFTSRIPLSDARTLYYNALKDMYVVVDKDVDSRIVACDFAHLNSKVAEDLAEAGITVSDDFDENKELSRLKGKSPAQYRTLSITG